MEQHKSEIPETLCNLAAERATLRVRIKQEYDKAGAIVNSFNKIKQEIELCKRDSMSCEEIIEMKQQESEQLEEESFQVSMSREHIQRNTENLKKQFELMKIEEEQKKMERNQVRSSYKGMIRSQNEIYNSYPLVAKRNAIANECFLVKLRLEVSKKQLHDLKYRKEQLDDITRLRLRNAVVEFVQVVVDVKKLHQTRILLLQRVKDQSNKVTERQEEQQRRKREEKKTIRHSIFGSTIFKDRPTIATESKFTLPTFTSRTSLTPDLKSNDYNGLQKYLQQMSSMTINHRELHILSPTLANKYCSQTTAKRSNISDMPVTTTESDKVISTINTDAQNPLKTASVTSIQKVQSVESTNEKMSDDVAASSPKKTTAVEVSVKKIPAEPPKSKTDSYGPILYPEDKNDANAARVNINHSGHLNRRLDTDVTPVTSKPSPPSKSSIKSRFPVSESRKSPYGRSKQRCSAGAGSAPPQSTIPKRAGMPFVTEKRDVKMPQIRRKVRELGAGMTKKLPQNNKRIDTAGSPNKNMKYARMEPDFPQKDSDNRSKYFTNEKQTHGENAPPVTPYEENQPLSNPNLFGRNEKEISTQNQLHDENAYSDKFSSGNSEPYSPDPSIENDGDLDNQFQSSNMDIFQFGNSINQIFGSSNQPTPSSNAANNEAFDFNFAEEPSTSSGGFQLFF